MKNPYLVEVYGSKKELGPLENYFTEEKNISFLPEEIQYDIQNCLVEIKPDNENVCIMYVLEQTINFLKSVLNNYGVSYKIKQIRKDIHYGDYPFEVSEEFKHSLNESLTSTLGFNEILEKIKDKGINSISDSERQILLSFSLDIS